MKRLGKTLTLCALTLSMGLISACGVKAAPPDPQPPAPVYYRNPVTQIDAADPHIIRHDGYFYVFATGKKLFKSPDAVAWTQVEGGVDIQPTWGTKGAGFWAPDIQKIGDKFLLYYSLSTWGDANPGIGVASADSPEGPWTDHGKLFTSNEIGVDNSIDANVFVGQDGKVYMVWGSFRGIFGVRLTDDGTALDGTVEYWNEHKVLLAGMVGPWNGATFEGAYVVYKDGYYYMFLSSGTCCAGLNSTYNVRVGRSREPLGEYTDSDGAGMKNENVGHLVLQGSGKFVGPGHNSVFIDDNGDFFIVYHVYVNDNGQAKGRYMAMDKLIWKDGFCEVLNRMPSNKAVVPVVKSGE